MICIKTYSPMRKALILGQQPNTLKVVPRTSLGLERGSEKGVLGSCKKNNLKSNRGSKPMTYVLLAILQDLSAHALHACVCVSMSLCVSVCTLSSSVFLPKNFL